MSRALERRYERKNINNVWRVSKGVDEAYNQLGKKVGLEIKRYSKGKDILSIPDSFSWRKHQSFGYKINGIIGEFNGDVTGKISASMERGWGLANKKNNILAGNYLKQFRKATGEKASFFNANVSAMNQFMNRSINGLNLSENVWKMGDQAMDIIETHMNTGIAAGRSAAELSRDVRNVLKEPNKYLKKPPKGVYKSPYKNAMRMARTETNMAYRQADHMRYKQMDFVIGIQVHLSSQHPLPDICDAMEGRYPKTFQFLGWHPNCFCYQTSVLASKQDFLASLDGTPIPKAKHVTGMTKRATKYVQKHINKFDNYKTKPYWIANNRGHIQRALDTPVRPRGSSTKAYREAERHWDNLYEPSGYGKDMYEKAMTFDSPEMQKVLKNNGLTKDQLYAKITKTRNDLKTLKPTIDKYYNKDTGLFTAAREKEHTKIIEHFLSGKPSAAAGEAKMLLTGGYPGSGKSTMLNQAFPGWKKKFVHIDSDEIKNLLARVDGFKDVGWRASAYHREAAKVIEKLMDQALAANKHILFDGTMSGYHKVEKILNRFKPHGYKFDIAFADLPIDKSMERALNRFLGDSGRFVDPLYIATHGKDNLITFKKMQKLLKEYLENAVRYSTDVPWKTPAKLLEHKKY